MNVQRPTATVWDVLRSRVGLLDQSSDMKRDADAAGLPSNPDVQCPILEAAAMDIHPMNKMFTVNNITNGYRATCNPCQC